MTLYRENRHLHKQLLFLPATLLTFALFSFISAFFPKSVSDIASAPGLTESMRPFTLRESLSESAVLYIVIVAIYMGAFLLAKIFRITNIFYVSFCGLAASLLGLILARTSLGTAFTWSMIINLHLKNGGETGIDFTVRWLQSLFSVGVGLFSAFILMGINLSFSNAQVQREKVE